MESYNPFSLAGKTILITGASSGIGKAVAIEVSKMGARVIITGRNKECLNDTFQSLAPTSENIQIAADLRNEADIDALTDALPKLDGFVNNAGLITYTLAQFVEKKDILNLFEVNAFAPFILTQQLLQKKRFNKEASLVFMSSISGVYISTLGEGIYSATKSAINGYMKALALEQAHRGIRVNTVNPGITETFIFSDGAVTPELLEERKKDYPLKRFGKPEEIAYAVIYLLSDASKWVTGTDLKIDGGYTLK
ncbi:MAG: SDR family oxidoreductase [Dysgonamonadaceae bacterium]|jgi:NAD(P)-dependent dehydrogenase (short-subunit alcohol dehydrogenase family)|nr:SDR family oxidoreductase [Dysgonamonadaceae bacterium]